MKNIYIGKYLHKKSLFHNFHPIFKFIVIIFLIIQSSVIADLFDIIKYYLIFILILTISKIKLKEVFLIINPFKYLLIFTFFLQLFYNVTPLDGKFISALEPATITTSKFLLMILFSSILTLTTRPIDIIKVLYFNIKPLVLFKINIENIIISGIIALRFIPLLFEEANKIMDAQRYRGNIPKKGLMQIFRIDAFIIPLIIRVLYYAEQISVTLKFRKNWKLMLGLNKPIKKDVVILTIFLVSFMVINLV